jgi:hypothetical protein
MFYQFTESWSTDGLIAVSCATNRMSYSMHAVRYQRITTAAPSPTLCGTCCGMAQARPGHNSEAGDVFFPALAALILYRIFVYTPLACNDRSDT